MASALGFFRSFCIVLTGRHNSSLVKENLKALQKSIKEGNVADLEEEDEEDRAKEPRDEEEDRRNGKTIIQRSPFSAEFRKVFEEVQEQLAESNADSQTSEDNPYHCPAIIEVLFEHYLGVFPLWS